MQGISIFCFLLIALASFRLTRLIVYDKITEFLRAPFLQEVTEHDENGEEVIYLIPRDKRFFRFVGELISCHWCTGIWVSGFLVSLHLVFPLIGDVLILILSIAAVGSLVEIIVQNHIE